MDTGHESVVDIYFLRSGGSFVSHVQNSNFSSTASVPRQTTNYKSQRNSARGKDYRYIFYMRPGTIDAKIIWIFFWKSPRAFWYSKKLLGFVPLKLQGGALFFFEFHICFVIWKLTQKNSISWNKSGKSRNIYLRNAEIRQNSMFHNWNLPRSSQ